MCPRIRDRTSVTFTVATDPTTGKLAVTSAGINFQAPCKNESYAVSLQPATALPPAARCLYHSKGRVIGEVLP